MQMTPTVTFRGLDRSPALETEIHRRIAKLGVYSRSILGCRVLVSLSQRRHVAGNRYRVRIDLAVPGNDIVVVHEAGLRTTSQDVDAARVRKADEAAPESKYPRVAIHQAFDIARRRLQERARKRRRR